MYCKSLWMNTRKFSLAEPVAEEVKATGAGNGFDLQHHSKQTIRILRNFYINIM